MIDGVRARIRVLFIEAYDSFLLIVNFILWRMSWKDSVIWKLCKVRILTK